MFRRIVTGAVALVVAGALGVTSAEADGVVGERRGHGGGVSSRSLGGRSPGGSPSLGSRASSGFSRSTSPGFRSPGGSSSFSSGARSLGSPSFRTAPAPYVRSAPVTSGVAGERRSPFAGNPPAARRLPSPTLGHSPFVGGTTVRPPTTVTPRVPTAPTGLRTPGTVTSGHAGTAALDRLRTRGPSTTYRTSSGGVVGVRQGTGTSPAGDTRIRSGVAGTRMPGTTTALPGGSRTLQPRTYGTFGNGQGVAGVRRGMPGGTVAGGTHGPASGLVRGARTGSVSVGGSRAGVVSHGSGAPIAGMRRGSVSYYGAGGVAAHGGGHRRGSVSYYGHVHHHAGGRYVAWWNPYYYNRYSSCWYGGLPAFGFGVAWYDSSYDPWFDTWGGGPVYMPAPTYVYPSPTYVMPADPMPVQPAPLQVPPAEIAPEGVLPPDGADNALPPAAPEQPGAFPPPAEPPGAAQPPAGAEGAAPGPMDETARKAFEESFRAFQEGRYEDAFRGLDGMVQADPQNGEAWMGRFYAAFALGRLPEAATSLGEAGKLGAFPRGYRFDPRPIFQAQGERRFDDLFEALKQLAQAKPQDADAHLVLAYFQVALGKRAEADAEIAWVRTLRPDHPLLPALATALLPPEPPPTSPDEDAPAAPTAPSSPGAR